MLGMRPPNPQDKEYSFPIFEGTSLLGMGTASVITGEEPRPILFFETFDEPLLLLPNTITQIGGTWDVSSDFFEWLDDDPGTTDLLDAAFRLTGSVVGVEDVTVPAGEFEDCLRVSYTGEISLQLGLGGGETAYHEYTLAVPGTATIWYAPGVGPVKGIANASLVGEVEVVLKGIA